MTDSWDAFSVVTLVEISLADLTTDGLVGVPDAFHTASHTPASTYEGRTFGRRLALSTRKPEAERLLLTTDEILGRDDTGLASGVFRTGCQETASPASGDRPTAILPTGVLPTRASHGLGPAA